MNHLRKGLNCQDHLCQMTIQVRRERGEEQVEAFANMLFFSTLKPLKTMLSDIVLVSPDRGSFLLGPVFHLSCAHAHAHMS